MCLAYQSGKALNGLWKGQDVVEAAAVSNATREVAGESGLEFVNIDTGTANAFISQDSAIRHQLKIMLKVKTW